VCKFSLSWAAQVAEAERRRKEEERLAVLAFAEEMRIAEEMRRKDEEDAARAAAEKASRTTMTMAELNAERKAEKEREKVERERMKERMREQEAEEHRLATQGTLASRSSRPVKSEGDADGTPELNPIEPDLVFMIVHAETHAGNYPAHFAESLLL